MEAEMEDVMEAEAGKELQPISSGLSNVTPEQP